MLPRTPSTNQKLEGVLGSLKSLALDPGTNLALNGLNATVGTLNPMIRYLGPYVTVCNQFNYFWEEIQDLVSEQTSFGMAQRALIQFNNHQASNAGVAGSRIPPTATSRATRRAPGIRATPSTRTAPRTPARSPTTAPPTARSGSAATPRSSTA